MPWFLILDLDAWKPDWPASYKGSRVTLQDRMHLGGSDLPSSFRASPVFPIQTAEPPQTLSQDGTWYLDFFCPRDPFREIGRLVAQLEAGLQARLWFTLGAAALFSVARDPSFAQEIRSLLRETSVPQERWTLVDGQLVEVEIRNPPLTSGPPNRPQAPDYSSLPLDLRGVVDEFMTSLQVLLAPIEAVSTSDASVYHRLAEEVFEMVGELLYLNNPFVHDSMPAGLSNHAHPTLIADPLTRVKLIHQRTDRIIQINSALAYVTSQLHSGTPPILERRCLVRRYSLLGIGTGVRALLRLARHVDAAFSEGRVESVLANLFRASTSRPLPGLVDKFGHDPSDWGRLNVGDLSQNVPPSVGPSKIVYFSGRLGFRETEFSVSVALQVLWAGDTLEWSPNTLSHELLHGHVRNVLSQVFGSPQGRNSIEYGTAMYSRFADAMQNGPQEDMTALESVRFVLLSYCCLVPGLGSLTSPPGEVFERRNRGASEEVVGGLQLYPEDSLWGILEHQYRNISEIIVHVLDLHYFYRSRLEIYLPFIWHSWAAVPIVVRDLRQYVLRSLLAAASAERGGSYQRFSNAVSALKRHVFASPPAPPHYSLVPGVLAYLDDKNLVESLYLPFTAALRVADLARHVLFSSRIRSALFAADDLLEITQDHSGEHLHYRLEDLEFQDLYVASPTAFLLDRLQRLMAQQVQDSNSDRRTAWLLLALASGPEESDER